ncbi:MAG: hypothetical protein L0Z50_05690 [Verrucomicrobiales bacterium]|nr:hypothetical protein [Verrucomicrobiales bacterium]
MSPIPQAKNRRLPWQPVPISFDETFAIQSKSKERSARTLAGQQREFLIIIHAANANIAPGITAAIPLVLPQFRIALARRIQKRGALLEIGQRSRVVEEGFFSGTAIHQTFAIGSDFLS